MSADMETFPLADAARFVARAVDPTGSPTDIEHTARIVMQPGRARALLLKEAASNLRHSPDGLRRLLAARERLLHGPSSERPKAEHLTTTGAQP